MDTLGISGHLMSAHVDEYYCCQEALEAESARLQAAHAEGVLEDSGCAPTNTECYWQSHGHYPGGA